MSLAIGSKLGPYEILSALGAGGMGEVYRARDTKLNRDVAIKVLLPAVANDPDRLARFSREAQVLASLNHPNIAAIYGLEEGPADAADDGPAKAGHYIGANVASGFSRTIALVMELVEGEDLAQRIARGPIPLAEALPIACQIAEALEAAHEQGIIHRDLKPANIKVRPDGTVKVLDFGLAKAMDPAGASNPNAMNSPTLSIHATEAGLILGTAAYMSPEQARGSAVDRRADVWAFGVVLFEMLAGRRPFEGETLSDTLASVLKTEPAWDAIPTDVPTAIRRLLTICLTKDVRARLRDIGEARRQIDEVLGGRADVATPMAIPVQASRWMRAVPWAVSGLLGIALVAALAIWSPWQSPPSPPNRSLLTSIGADASMPTEQGASAVLSPDGTMLAFVGQRAERTLLFVRKLNQLDAVEFTGTEGAQNPFFSPDGQWVAFFAAGRLKKVPATGGAVQEICVALDNRGGTWTEDNTIIFAPTRRTLARVSAGGGVPVPLGALPIGASSENAQRWPQALPGGTLVLYTQSVSATLGFDVADLVVATHDGSAPKVVVRGAYYGRYLPSGHLVYLQQGKLFAVPFDISRLETSGRAVAVLDGLVANPSTGGAQFAFASDGTFVYAPGAAFTSAKPIDWLARDGKVSVLSAARSDWRNPRFSPDGQKLAFGLSDGLQNDLWVSEWARQRLTQLTFDSAWDIRPVWSADGERITFASDRAKTGTYNLYWTKADGSGEATRLTEGSDNQTPGSWHPSGKFLAFTAIRPTTGSDLLILPMAGDVARGLLPRQPTDFLSTSANESDPVFSPDGRWIAYVSNESGGSEVYVRPFPGLGGPWRISSGGASYPEWSRTTSELLFYAPGKGNRVMSATYDVVGASFHADTPQLWTRTAIVPNGAHPYDLHPDGKRLAASAASDEGGVLRDKVVFVSNFFDHLRKIAPVGKP